MALRQCDVEVDVHRRLDGHELIPRKLTVVDHLQVIQVVDVRPSHDVCGCALEQCDGAELSDHVLAPERFGEDPDIEPRAEVASLRDLTHDIKEVRLKLHEPTPRAKAG